MDEETLAAYKEIVQGYYIKIHWHKPDVETIMQWLEADLNTIREFETLNEALKILSR